MTDPSRSAKFYYPEPEYARCDQCNQAYGDGEEFIKQFGMWICQKCQEESEEDGED